MVESVEYLDGKMEKSNEVFRPGNCIVKYENGDRFKGNFAQVVRTKADDGDKFVRDGKGEYTFSSGAKFVGEYRAGLKDGIGSYTYPSGDIYRGKWKKGVKEGHGTMTYANGDKFTGMWANDKKNGRGSYVYASGANLVGTWFDGKFQEGRWHFPNGVPQQPRPSPAKPPRASRRMSQKTSTGGQTVNANNSSMKEMKQSAESSSTAASTAVAATKENSEATAASAAGATGKGPAEPEVAPLGVVISGAPASGKGTQCEQIRRHFGVVHLSTGDMLRAAVAAGTKIGLEAKELMESGQLVPDHIVIGAVHERLSQDDVRQNGFLLDGFPRTAAQAEALKELGYEIDVFLMLNVPDDHIVGRVTGRRIDPETGNSYHIDHAPPPEEISHRVIQRSDDTEEKVRVRLEGFHNNIKAIKDFFSEKIVEVDGAKHPEHVWTHICGILEEKKEEIESN